jgi:hypothetical protein
MRRTNISVTNVGTESCGEEKKSTYADVIYADLPDAENGVLPPPDAVGPSPAPNCNIHERFAIEQR